MRLKVISLNIHKGFNWAKTKVTLERLKNMINASSADIVFLQEIVGEHARHARRFKDRGWPAGTQLEYLADTIWRHHIYERNAISSFGHHGNAVLSKYPIRWWRNYNISTNTLERRGLLECHVEIPHRRSPRRDQVIAFCTHINLAWGRKRQHKAIMSRISHIRDKKAPLILAGDFNDWDGIAEDVMERYGLKEAFKERHGDYARTFPDFLPILPLDRIYFRNLKILEAKRLDDEKWRKLSDHSALFCIFELA